MKRKTLLVLNSQELTDLYTLNLQGYLDSEVLLFSKADPVKALLEQDRKVDLVVTLGEISKESTASEICQVIEKESMRVPVIILGMDDIEEIKKTFKTLRIESCPQSDDVRKCIQLAMKILNVTAKDIEEIPSSPYFPIALTHFYTLKNSLCDIFMKIGHGEKYLKRVNQGDGLDPSVLDRYAQHGARNLFIEAKNRIAFINDLTGNITQIISEGSEEERIQGEQVAMELVQTNVDDLANPEIVQLAKSVMKSMVKDVKSYPKLAKMLGPMLKNKTSFAYKHTKLVSYFGLSILKEMDWAKKEQEETITFLSMFHDISLTSDEMVKIESKEELRASDLNEEDKNLVEKHALESAGLIANYPKAPMGVATLIKQHHGVMNGIGFSDGFSGNLSPLVVIFIVAEHSAHFVLKNSLDQYDGDKIINHLREKFATSRFKRMVDALEAVI